MKWYLILSFVSSMALAVPQGYIAGTKARQDQSQGNCICFEQSQETLPDGTIKGVYSYEDPVGSTITVTYTNGPEGYSEKRRITKNTKLTFTQFKEVKTSTTTYTFTTFLQRIEPLVANTIQFVIREFGSLPLSSITEEIESNLRSEVLRAVKFMLSETENEVTFDAEMITDNVVHRLGVLITDSVKARYDDDRVIFPGNVDVDDLVTVIVSQIKIIIEEAIESHRSSIVFPTPNEEVNKQVTIIKEQMLSEPIVTQVVTHVEEKESEVQGATRPDTQSIVAKVLTAIKPIIIEAVRDHTSVTTTTTVTNEQPAVVIATAEVQEEFSKDLVTDLVLQLQPVIGMQVSQAFASPDAFSLSNKELADLIVDGMSSEIHAVIARTTQGDATYTAAKVQRLYTRLVGALRPLILETITQFRAVQVQQLESKVLSESFIQSVVDAILSEIKTIITRILSQIGSEAIFVSSESSLTQDILEKIDFRHIIGNVITQNGISVSNNFYSSETYNKLVEMIIVRLRALLPDYIRAVREDQLQIIRLVISSIRSSLRPTVMNIMESYATTSDAEIIEETFSVLNIPIQQEILLVLKTFENGVYADVNGLQQLLYEKIVAELRIELAQIIMTIRTEIRLQQEQQQQQQQKKKQVVVTPTGTSSSPSSPGLKSIFGISGQNTVRVETPGYHYAYEHK